VVFPFVVLGVFIWLLIRYPGNLYSPWQYTSEVGVETYTTALDRQVRTTSKVYRAAALKAFSANEGSSGEWSDPEGEDVLLERIEKFVRDSSITVDRSRIIPRTNPVQIPVTDETTVGDLLDTIYFEIATIVHPFSYGSSWVLKDEDGSQLTELGTRWAGHVRDERRLNEVGITPGQTLFAEQLTRPTRAGFQAAGE